MTSYITLDSEIVAEKCREFISSRNKYIENKKEQNLAEFMSHKRWWGLLRPYTREQAIKILDDVANHHDYYWYSRISLDTTLYAQDLINASHYSTQITVDTERWNSICKLYPSE